MRIRKKFQGVLPEHRILDTISSSQTDTYSCRKINELVANAGGTGGGGTTSPSDILNLVYPVGSIYMSINNVSPQTFLGGTWEEIKGRFLLGASETYEAGSEGGESEHKLTVNEMPSHTHPVTGGASTGGSITAPQSYSSYFKTTRSMAGIATATGGSQAHNNMPPYLTVYMWKRIA